MICLNVVQIVRVVFFERSNPKLNLICGVTQEDANNVGKPDWCPLKPMIEKKDRNKVVGDYLRGRCDGYNTCIDEILGDKEQRNENIT
jgi:hypothetical protein